MDFHLRQKIVNKLSNLYELESTYSLRPNNIVELIDCHDVNAVLSVIDNRVTSLVKVWDNVQRGMTKARVKASKDANFAEVAFLDAKFRLDRVSEIGANNAQAKEMNEILNLIDLAIVNCPVEFPAHLANMYALRFTVLDQCNEHDQALINIDRAIQLAPSEMLYYVQKVKHLCAANRLIDAKQFTEQLLGQMDTDEQHEQMRSLWKLLLQIIKKRLVADKTCDNGNKRLSGNESKKQNFELDYRCRLETNAKKGRHMVASDEIASNELIIKEQAYSLVLLSDQLLNKCAFCFRSVTRIFWPCFNCNSAVYCGEQCARHHWSLIHRVECGLIQFWLNKSKSMFHVFRQFALVGVDGVLDLDQRCDLPPFDMFTFIHDAEQKCVAEMDKDQDTRLKTYKAMLSLQHHSDKFEESQGPALMVTAIECAMIALMVHDYAFDQISHDRLVELVSQAFFNVRRVSLNSFCWHELDERGNKVSIATVVCLLASMLNHSCNPSGEWTFTDGIFHLSTIKPVRSGQEITISYGPSTAMSFEDRQQRIAQYYFQCNCECCLEDAKTVLALQCPQCPGPVLCNSAVFGDDNGEVAICLVCTEPLPDAKDKLKQMTSAREELHLIAQLLCGVSEANKRKVYLSKMKEILHLIKSLIYRKSYLLVEDIFAACKTFHREGMLEQCLPFGDLVNELLPLKGARLMSLTGDLPTAKLYTCLGDTTLFDVNIDHLLFWASSVYRFWIEQTDTKDRQLWDTMIRFYYRAEKVIKAVVAEKKQRLAKLPSKPSFDTIGLQEEISLLETLQQIKAQEFEKLQQQLSALLN